MEFNMEFKKNNIIIIMIMYLNYNEKTSYYYPVNIGGDDASEFISSAKPKPLAAEAVRGWKAKRPEKFDILMSAGGNKPGL
jgi:hypothetical protein